MHSTTVRNRPFDPIRPGDIDVFAYDFVDELGTLGVIESATWTVAQSARSTANDPDATTRILSVPIFDETKTSVKAGEMLDGVIYVLTATIITTDQRRLSYSADVLCMLEPIPVPVPTGIVVFDYDEWIYRFPEMQYIDPDRALRYFNGAELFHRNDSSNPMSNDVPFMTSALYLLTAHLAQLGGTATAGGGSGSGIPSWVVGRISSASQGPISVSAEGYQLKGANAAWYAATSYGAAYYTLMARFRTFNWRRGPLNRATIVPAYINRFYFGR